MKKLLAMVLTVSMTAAMVGCGQAAETTETAAESTAVETVESTAAEETATESAEESTAAEEAAGDVLSYADYVAADLDSEVTIESYVQAKQSWWEDKATVYTQDKDGAYFLYDMACSEEDYEKLVPGVKIRVTGYKSEWSGEVELMDATFEFVEGADEYIAPAVDVTDLLGTDELIDHQNQHVTFTDLTVEAAGQDADGNWGYKTGGADTVIPFKGDPDFDYEHGISIPYVVAAGNPNVLHYYTMTAEDAAYSYLALFAVTAGSVVSIELSGVSGPSIVCNKPGGSYSFVLIANPVLNGKVNFRHGGTGDGHVYKLRIR